MDVTAATTSQKQANKWIKDNNWSTIKAKTEKLQPENERSVPVTIYWNS